MDVKSAFFVFFFTISSLVQLQSIAGQDVVRAGYWFPDSGITASQIDSSLFTHLFCAFIDLDSTTNRVVGNELFSQFTQSVRQNNPSVKALLSIGGGDANKAAALGSMAREFNSRKSFIDSSIQLARDYGFNGLDLDWEYPQGFSDMVNFGSLLDEWRAAVAAEAASSGNPPLILTAAVSYGPKVDGVLEYPIPNVSSRLDWINVMAYDFYDPTRSDVTNSHAALYDPSGRVSASYGIGAWTQSGMSPKKIVLGIPFIGYAYRLANPDNHGFLAPAKGPAGEGKGAMQYRDIKKFISDNRATAVYNFTIVSDYCFAGTTWICYDDVQNISAKVSYSKLKGLLGYFGWHVAADDSSWTLSKKAKQTWEA